MHQENLRQAAQISHGPMGPRLERIPIEVPWGLILVTVGAMVLIFLIGRFFILSETRKIDPNAVVRDNGSP